MPRVHKVTPTAGRCPNYDVAETTPRRITQQNQCYKPTSFPSRQPNISKTLARTPTYLTRTPPQPSPGTAPSRVQSLVFSFTLFGSRFSPSAFFSVDTKSPLLSFTLVLSSSRTDSALSRFSAAAASAAAPTAALVFSTIAF